MKTKYIIIIFGSFTITTTVFIYMMFSGNWLDFLSQIKWFMRITAPFLIIYLFYLGVKDSNKKKS